MYIKVKNGKVEKYPYTIGDLRRDNPNTSFPREIPAEVMEDYGMYSVSRTNKPVVDYTKSVKQGDPVLVEGRWVQQWIVTEATPQEIAVRTEREAQKVRKQRDELLAKTDWMALSDSTLSNEWAEYRRLLREVPQQPNFPHDVSWPIEPSSS